MVELWVRLVESGKKNIDNIPQNIYDAVYARLVEDGFIDEK